MTTVLIGIGDGYSSDGFVDLSDFVRDAPLIALPSVVIPFDITPANIAQAVDAVNEINHYLSLAAEASRPHGTGTRVVCSLRLPGAPWAYIDILNGALTVPPETITGAHLETGWLQNVGLALNCLPFGRLDPVPVPVSGTFTHGDEAVYVIDEIPGDAPGLVELTVTDVSTDTQALTPDIAINRVRAAIYSGHRIEDDAYTFVHDLTNGADGTETTTGNTVGGKYSSVTASEEWQTVATMELSSRGLQELWLRMRDSSAAATDLELLWDAGYPTIGSTGSLAAGTYRIIHAALAGGSIIALSEPRTITISGTTFEDGIKNSWDAVAGADDYRTYVKKDTDAYVYDDWGDTLTVHQITTLVGWTTGDPPGTASAEVLPAQVRVTLSTGSGLVQFAQTYVSANVGNSVWHEVRALPPAILPPLARSEHRSDPTTQIDIEVRAANGDSLPDVDVDAIISMPRANGQYMSAQWYWNDLGTKRGWRLETNRYGEPIAYLIDGSGNEVGTLNVDGSLYVQPRPQRNLVYIRPTVQGGTSDVTDCRYTVSARVVPRWRTLGGGRP